METKEKELTLTQQIAQTLSESADDNPEGYTGAEMIEALAALPDDTVLPIPWCIYDIQLDEFGEAKVESKYDHLGKRKDLDEDENEIEDWEPAVMRRVRWDVTAVLAWIPMRREDPEMTLDRVKGMLRDGNIGKIIRMTFAFWGVPLKEIEERVAEEVAAEEESEEEKKERKEQEAEDAENFIE